MAAATLGGTHSVLLLDTWMGTGAHHLSLTLVSFMSASFPHEKLEKLQLPAAHLRESHLCQHVRCCLLETSQASFLT